VKPGLSSRLLPFGLALCPMLMVAVVPVLREVKTPAQASAAPKQQSFVQPELPQQQAIDAGQIAAADHLRSLRAGETPALPTPFVMPKPQPVPVAEVARPVQPPGQPTTHISAILTGPRPVAVINGRPMRIGQQFESEWFVEAIDAANGIVTFVHQTDPQRSFTVRLHRDLPNG
jgi:hypothetical protein